MTNNALKSWLDISPESDFSIYNLPYGIFSTPTQAKTVGVALGEYIIDLAALAESKFWDIPMPASALRNGFLNDFIGLGSELHAQVRQKIQTLFTTEVPNFRAEASKFLVLQSAATLHLPVRIGDYTDFYSSLEHASNVGSMFRDANNPLLPNWKHLPVGYHGRSSSIVISGTPIKRPWGQIKPPTAESPIFQPSQQMDFELEVAFVIGKSTQLGQRVNVNQAEEYIFGFVLFNDWSARDIQSWEYVPLGPFLGKNFGSSVSAWVVPLAALEPFRTAAPTQDPPPLPYLQADQHTTFDLNLTVALQPQNGLPQVICQSNFKYLYWSVSQQIAHHTVNGCNLNIGDMCASGTISGSQPDSFGSMLELTWRGTKPLKVQDVERKFLADYDTLTIRGVAQKGEIRVGFGEVKGQILPADPTAY